MICCYTEGGKVSHCVVIADPTKGDPQCTIIPLEEYSVDKLKQETLVIVTALDKPYVVHLHKLTSVHGTKLQKVADIDASTLHILKLMAFNYECTTSLPEWCKELVICPRHFASRLVV